MAQLWLAGLALVIVGFDLLSVFGLVFGEGVRDRSYGFNIHGEGGCADEVIGLDAPGCCVVAPSVCVGACGGAGETDCCQAIDFVGGDPVDVWAVDPGGVVNGAVEVGVFDQPEVHGLGICSTDMGHHALVLDLVEVECPLES